jgi:C-lobe and N-lobe beta barrels of Tf-binding protein B
MMKHYCMAAVLAALSACGGSGGSGVSQDVMGVNIPGGVVGRQFVANAASVEYDSASPSPNSPVTSIQESVKFISATQAELTIGNGAPITLVYDATSNFFVDSTGNFFLAITDSLDGVTHSKEHLYFLISDFSNPVTYYDSFVHGNRTPVSSMPTSGQAVYSGVVDMIDGTGLQSETIGSFNLTADFVNSQISGSLFGVLPADTSLTFDLVPVTINGNGFITGLTSTGTTVNGNSLVNGRFFGPTAGEVGGTIVLDTAAGTAAGIFGSSTP